MEERRTPEQVTALAPDVASHTAGSKPATPAHWSGTGFRPSGVPGGAVVWGVCAGSGSTPYRTVVDVRRAAEETPRDGTPGASPDYSCSCPSRKFPCKHALGLLLLWSGGAVGAAEPPDWVTRWLDARRAREDRNPQGGPMAAGPADPAAARRRAERREQRVTAGVTELERRLADLLGGGLAGADREGYRIWDDIAARMIDAQAPGLAGRVRELAAVTGSGGDRASRLLEESAMLHLLAQGYLHRERLPAGLAATVRGRVGFTTEAAELLAGPTVRDRWLVLAQHDSTDERLITRRIWLRGADSGATAVLMSFGAAGRVPELTLPLGRSLDAEVAYYPAARPLRAVLGARHTAPERDTAPAGVAVGAALDAYAAALADDPWLDAWPVVLSGVVPVPGTGTDGWQLADADGSEALPVAGRAPWRLAAVSGGHPVTVFGEVGHRGLRPLTAWEAGPSRDPVPL